MLIRKRNTFFNMARVVAIILASLRGTTSTGTLARSKKRLCPSKFLWRKQIIFFCESNASRYVLGFVAKCFTRSFCFAVSQLGYGIGDIAFGQCQRGYSDTDK